ncbi:RagB/SusD family nutrient uptake outer membrane protein [Sabulibacter ruber]|uniref:RagB/SusD family nutrient uptake outer membrane protein n=1 Tax=Sabulibacter ruber TaxID=2811901 RepID=UPI001A96BBBE|nr:RagB/SusD family nutrient uptake outer membrane protein [Sabulibacter ruber]
MKTPQYLLAFFLAFTAVSCDSFLDVEPKQYVSDEQTILDGASAETAVRGMYRTLSANGYYGTTFPSIGYLSGDNIQWTGSQAITGQFVNHEVRADNSILSTLWSSIYKTINSANHVIAKVPTLPLEPSFPQAKKDQLLGEAYFVRALSYFDLARVWGGVPLYLQPTLTATDNRGIPRSMVADTYAQVLKDLTEAEKLLPNTTNRIRATQKTVWALRARYHLYQKEWALAEEYASKLIGEGNYTLVKPYSAWWANNVVASQESVFELAYSAANTNSHRGNWQPPTNGGTRQWAPNTAFVDLVSNPAIGGNRSALVSKTADGRWYGNLYYRSPATDPAYVIRIAELYLIRAEARAQQGGTTKLEGALADLNAVRSRADLPALTPITDQAALLLAIENERRIEFAFEPHRWFDLVRTDRAAAVLGLTDARRYVLPLPVDEITLDKALVQNEGY